MYNETNKYCGWNFNKVYKYVRSYSILNGYKYMRVQYGLTIEHLALDQIFLNYLFLEDITLLYRNNKKKPIKRIIQYVFTSKATSK